VSDSYVCGRPAFAVAVAVAEDENGRVQVEQTVHFGPDWLGLRLGVRFGGSLYDADVSGTMRSSQTIL